MKKSLEEILRDLTGSQPKKVKMARHETEDHVIFSGKASNRDELDAIFEDIKRQIAADGPVKYRDLTLQEIGKNNFNALHGTLNLRPAIKPEAGKWYRTYEGGFAFIIGQFPMADQLRADMYSVVKGYEWVGIMVDPQGNFRSYIVYNEAGYSYYVPRVGGKDDAIKLVDTDLMEEVDASEISMGSRLHFMLR